MGLPGINIKLVIEKLLVFFRITDPFVRQEHKHLVPVSRELFLPVFSLVHSDWKTVQTACWESQAPYCPQGVTAVRVAMNSAPGVEGGVAKFIKFGLFSWKTF